MSKFTDMLTSAIFFSSEKPQDLAEIIDALVNPENMSADINLEDKEVANATTLASIKGTLPTKGSAKTSTGLPYDYTITWGADTTPTYVAATAGDYTLSGTIGGLPTFVTNTGSKAVKVKIVVAEEEVTEP